MLAQGHMIDIRKRIEEREDSLSPFAAKSRTSRGRLKAEKPCPIRTDFQQDRDRIIHSLSFRRLKHKTQVFIAPTGDHFVTRLTHTLEVSQIARTIARALNLNEDLTEAIALGHDLGHTPFGHVGEHELSLLCPGGFKHNEQSLRVVDLLEKDGQGLNLTWETRDGILNHSKGQAEIFGPDWGDMGTFEGELCKISDVIAYVNHDIGDAIRAGAISESDLPQAAVSALGGSSSERIDTLVQEIVQYSWSASGLDTSSKPAIGMDGTVLSAINELRNFLFENVYKANSMNADSAMARETLRFLYNYFLGHIDRLPSEYLCREDGAERKVIDYISGMTDQYALSTFKRLKTA
jgi:dGTPase